MGFIVQTFNYVFPRSLYEIICESLMDLMFLAVLPQHMQGVSINCYGIFILSAGYVYKRAVISTTSYLMTMQLEEAVGLSSHVDWPLYTYAALMVSITIQKETTSSQDQCKS